MIGMVRVTQQSLYRRIATVGRLVDLMSIVNSLRCYRRKLVRAKAEERWGGVGGTKPIGWFSTASFDWHQAGGNAHIFAWNIHNLWEMSAHPIDPYWLTLYFALPRSQISKSAVRNRITCHVPALSLSLASFNPWGGKLSLLSKCHRLISAQPTRLVRSLSRSEKGIASRCS